MPKTRTDIVSDDLAALAVEVLPAFTLADHGLQVLQPRHAVLNGVFDDRAGEACGHVAGLHRAVAVESGARQASGQDADGLGGGERARRRLELCLAVFRHAAAQLAEHGYDATDLLHRRLLGGQLQRPTQGRHPPLHDLDLFVHRLGYGQNDRVEAACQCARKLVHALVAVVGRGDHVEALARLDLGVEFRNGKGFLGEDGYEGILNFGRNTGQLLYAAHSARAHGVHHRALHQGFLRRALGQEPRVVPTVADGGLIRTRGALYQERGIARDRGRQVLANPRLGRAWYAVEQQRPVGGQRGNGHLHQTPVAHVLGQDDKPVGQLSAHEVRLDGPRREFPVRRSLAVVGPGELGQLLGVLLLGVPAQYGVWSIGHSGISSTSLRRNSSVSRTASVPVPNTVRHDPAARNNL